MEQGPDRICRPGCYKALRYLLHGVLAGSRLPFLPVCYLEPKEPSRKSRPQVQEEQSRQAVHHRRGKVGHVQAPLFLRRRRLGQQLATNQPVQNGSIDPAQLLPLAAALLSTPTLQELLLSLHVHFHPGDSLLFDQVRLK